MSTAQDKQEIEQMDQKIKEKIEKSPLLKEALETGKSENEDASAIIDLYQRLQELKEKLK